MTFRQLFLPESLLGLRGIFRWVPEDVGNIPREFPSPWSTCLCLRRMRSRWCRLGSSTAIARGSADARPRGVTLSWLRWAIAQQSVSQHSDPQSSNTGDLWRSKGRGHTRGWGGLCSLLWWLVRPGEDMHGAQVRGVSVSSVRTAGQLLFYFVKCNCANIPRRDQVEENSPSGFYNTQGRAWYYSNWNLFSFSATDKKWSNPIKWESGIRVLQSGIWDFGGPQKLF